jgi:hypothetical protein
MKKIAIILSVFLTLSIQSCDDFFDVNNNPDQPVDAPYYMIHPRAVLGTAAVTGGQYAILGSLWSEHFTQSHVAQQYWQWICNNITPGLFSSSFDRLYIDAIKNYELVKSKAEAVENWKYYFMSTVMEAYTYQVLVDLHDEVPFSEAVQGLNGLVHPKYEKGQDIYNELINLINAAADKDLTGSSNNEGEAGTYDKIFQGDVNKWKQFANTLKLRMYIRQRYANPAVLDDVKDLLTENNFLTVDAKIGGFSNESGKYNPLYGSEVSSNGLGNANIRGCNTFLNFMQSNNDMRLGYIYKYARNTTTYVGLDYGDRPSTSVVPADGLSEGLFAATDPVVFLSVAESQFLQAEAKEWAGQSGKDNYDAGVLASFAKFGLDGSAYIAAGGVYEYPSTGDFEEKQKAIITQKWVDCAISNPIESFFEFNRTGYPDILIPSVNSVFTGTFPKRLPFSQSSISTNPNCPEVKDIREKVWWDKK